MNAYGQGVNTARPIGTTSSPYGYYEYLPLDYNSNSNNYPVVVFLHGAGQVGNGGSQLSAVLKHGPPKEVSKGKDYPFIIVTPQSSVSSWNVDNV
ncbi:MAG: hypothetical protein KY428_05625, partial [Bacteroidetes bacterium]|nr:hypothetical protein [Bacteroidota bacterium]